MFRNRVFVSITIGLCGLFFVVTGIQFYATKYLQSVYSTSRMNVTYSGNQSLNVYPDIEGLYIRRYTLYNKGMVFAKWNGAFPSEDDALMWYDTDNRWVIARLRNAWYISLPLDDEMKKNITIRGDGNWVRPDTAKWQGGYAVKPYVDQSLIHLSFAAVAATGPTLGVVVGGCIIDRAGGYEGHENLVRALKISTIFGGIATTIGVVTSTMDYYWVLVLGMWLVLFFGGGVLPAATGIVIAIVDAEMRPFANAMSMVLYNVFGYALGSIAPGAFMDWIKPVSSDEDESYDHVYIQKCGMRFILACSAVGFGGMAFAWLYTKYRGDRTKSSRQLRSIPSLGEQEDEQRDCPLDRLDPATAPTESQVQSETDRGYDLR